MVWSSFYLFREGHAKKMTSESLKKLLTGQGGRLFQAQKTNWSIWRPSDPWYVWSKESILM